MEIALNDLPKQIDGIDEIKYLIIDDGCKDNTVQVAKNWGVYHVVGFAQNKGLAKGFCAFSREAAMRINDYTYTLETIVQAGRNRMKITSVPFRTNSELRELRLFYSIW